MTGRKYLTGKEWTALLEAQGGTCINHWCSSTGPFHAEHSTPNALRPGKPDQLMCEACHGAKTAIDRANIAKAKRLSGETGSQYQRRKKFGPTFKGRNDFEGNRKRRSTAGDQEA